MNTIDCGPNCLLEGIVVDEEKCLPSSCRWEEVKSWILMEILKIKAPYSKLVVSDIVHDIAMLIKDKVYQFVGDGSFKGWVEIVTARATIRLLKKEGKHHLNRNNVYNVDDALDSYVPFEHQLVDVAKHLEKLSPQQNRVIIGIYYLGKSPSELAEDLDISVVTISRHKHEGLKALRRFVEGDDT